MVILSCRKKSGLSQGMKRLPDKPLYRERLALKTLPACFEHVLILDLSLTFTCRTHGTFRPFLPALIRKNEPDAVKKITREAFAAQAAESYKDDSAPRLPPKLAEAISVVSKLQGVGSATAPLLCSIFDPENVPFFEDDLYEWLFPKSDKLKYNLKEYQALFHATRKMQKRLGVMAVEIEKVGFVIGRVALFDDHQKEELEKLLAQLPEPTGSKNTHSVSAQQLEADTPPLAKVAQEAKSEEKESKSYKPSKAWGKKRSSIASDADGETRSGRRSKRTRQ